jgi:hypothetical protein
MFKRSDKVTTKLCCTCRFWTDSRGRPAVLSPGTDPALCRRFPPQVIPTLEHLKLAHNERRFERAYIPDDAWLPVHQWPATSYDQWCGEWAPPNGDDEERMREYSKLQKA